MRTTRTPGDFSQQGAESLTTEGDTRQHGKARNHGDLAPEHQANERLLARFLAATSHDSGATARTYVARIRSAVARYERMSGQAVLLSDVLRDAELMAAVFACDISLRTGGKIRRETVNATRTAFVALAASLPPLGDLSRDAARASIRTARALSSHRRGLRLMTKVGDARRASPAHVPTADEIGAVVERLRADGSPLGPQAGDVVALCYCTGLRVGAVLGLRRDHLRQYPDGRWWAVVAEKARHDRRQVEIRGTGAGLLERWAGLAPSDSLWAREGAVLDYRALCRELTKACIAASVQRFTPHALRHAFASDTAIYLGLRGVQLAGGWTAERVAESYIAFRPASGG